MKFLQFIQKYGYNLNPNKAIHVIAPSHEVSPGLKEPLPLHKRRDKRRVSNK